MTCPDTSMTSIDTWHDVVYYVTNADLYVNDVDLQVMDVFSCVDNFGLHVNNPDLHVYASQDGAAIYLSLQIRPSSPPLIKLKSLNLRF